MLRPQRRQPLVAGVDLLRQLGHRQGGAGEGWRRSGPLVTAIVGTPARETGIRRKTDEEQCTGALHSCEVSLPGGGFTECRVRFQSIIRNPKSIFPLTAL